MARIGSIAAAPFVGGQFVALYLGETRVPTVPGQPVISSASDLFATTTVTFLPPSDGGSTVTGYRFFFDGAEVTPTSGPSPGLIDTLFASFPAGYVGQTASVSAANAVGEGPKSAPVTVT
jgi:hypothetical protein